MGTNHSNFSENAGSFSGVRRGDAGDAMDLANHVTQTMKQTMAEIMPKWPETMNAPVMCQPLQSPPPEAPPPSALQFNVVVNGQTYGPYDLDALSQMTGAGQLNAQSQVWRQGMTDWQAAETVPELAGLFTGGTVLPPSVPTV